MDNELTDEQRLNNNMKNEYVVKIGDMRLIASNIMQATDLLNMLDCMTFVDVMRSRDYRQSVYYIIPANEHKLVMYSRNHVVLDSEATARQWKQQVDYEQVNAEEVKETKP